MTEDFQNLIQEKSLESFQWLSRVAAWLPAIPGWRALVYTDGGVEILPVLKWGLAVKKDSEEIELNSDEIPKLLSHTFGFPTDQGIQTEDVWGPPNLHIFPSVDSSSLKGEIWDEIKEKNLVSIVVPPLLHKLVSPTYKATDEELLEIANSHIKKQQEQLEQLSKHPLAPFMGFKRTKKQSTE